MSLGYCAVLEERLLLYHDGGGGGGWGGVFFQGEVGIRDLVRSRGLGDVYKRQGFRGERVEHGAGGDVKLSCHSGMVRRTRPQGRNCAPGNLEIPGSRWRTPRNDECALTEIKAGPIIGHRLP